MVIFHCYVSPPEGSYRDLNDPECCDLIQKIIPWVSTAFPRRANEWKMRDLWQGDQNNSFYVTQFTSEIIRVPQVLHQNFYPLNPSQNFPCFVRLQFRLFFYIFLSVHRGGLFADACSVLKRWKIGPVRDFEPQNISIQQQQLFILGHPRCAPKSDQ